MPFQTLSNHPRCNSACSVCHYKSLPYDEQLLRKTAWAKKQLAQFGESKLQELIPAPSDERLGYRHKSWLKCQYIDGELSFGMYRSVRFQGKWNQEFISWDKCPLHSESIQLMIQRLKELLPSQAPKLVSSELVGLWVGSPHLVIISQKQEMTEVNALPWEKILAPPYDRVWFHCNSQVGRKLFGHHPIIPIRGPAIKETHPIKAFRQVAQSLLIQARNQAIQYLLQSQSGLLLDLYCGTGELSQAIPASVNWIGIELSSEAVKYSLTLKPDERKIHEAYVGAVEQRLSDPRVREKIKGKMALYINPPRSGLSPEACDKVLELLDQNQPERIAYLSCSASSLARDLKFIQEKGYLIENLQPFDFFPQTEHFETLALLKKQDQL